MLDWREDREEFDERFILKGMFYLFEFFEEVSRMLMEWGVGGYVGEGRLCWEWQTGRVLVLWVGLMG